MAPKDFTSKYADDGAVFGVVWTSLTLMQAPRTRADAPAAAGTMCFMKEFFIGAGFWLCGDLPAEGRSVNRLVSRLIRPVRITRASKAICRPACKCASPASLWLQSTR